MENAPMTGRIAASRPARRSAAAAIAGAALFGCVSAGLAQAYPSNVVKLVVPFPGGGPLDFVARLLAEKLSASLKQPFIVDNRPGAAGNLGTEAVAKAAPHGSYASPGAGHTAHGESSSVQEIAVRSGAGFQPDLHRRGILADARRASVIARELAG
jgi:Tripartite tricarboxylate transporter family receptor